MQDEKGYAPSTIKTELSAIRFLHDHLDDPKYRLPNNDELRISLERRTFGNVDRTWSDDEFEGMIAIADREGRRDYVCALYLARHVGLRLHETYRIDTAIADNSLRTGNISIIGKNGKPRTVPIENEQVKALLKELRARTKRGHKLFVPDDVRTDIAMRRLEQFIAYYRSAVQDADSDRPMTYHGLRHTFAAEKYRALVDGGMGTLEAHLTVSQLLGHNRADVTDIYLASVKKGKEARDGE